jgi:N-methylhydantoinase A
VMRRMDEWSDEDRNAMLDELAHRVSPNAKSPKPKAQVWFARMRYVGQGHELDVPIAPKQSGEAVASAFTTQHSRRYGFTLPYPLEVVSVRHVTEGVGRQPKLARENRPTARRLDGPVSLALADATLYVAKGWRAQLLRQGVWLLEPK